MNDVNFHRLWQQFPNTVEGTQKFIEQFFVRRYWGTLAPKDEVVAMPSSLLLKLFNFAADISHNLDWDEEMETLDPALYDDVQAVCDSLRYFLRVAAFREFREKINNLREAGAINEDIYRTLSDGLINVEELV